MKRGQPITMDLEFKHTDLDNEDISIHRVGIGGHLHRLIPVKDQSGRIIQRLLKPFMVELRVRDVVQIMVGATLLAIPVSFTQETWDLGNSLPWLNVIMLLLISVGFLGTFVYYNFYQNYFRQYWLEYLKRLVAIYCLSFFMVGIILTIILQTPWMGGWEIAVKRIIIVTFPACMSAAITDTIK